MASLADLKLPDINSDKFDATDSKQIKSYLYQLNEQLRYLLGNIGEDQLSNDVQDQLDLIRQLINALAGNSGTTININTGDRTQGWKPSELKQLTEQIKGIGERLGSGNTTTGESGGGGAVNIESVDEVPTNPDPDTIYLIRGYSVLA